MSTAAIDLHAAPSAGTVGLVLANLATLIMALALGWPPSALLWPYWLQSLVIGAFAVRRMLTAPSITTEGLTSNGQPVPATGAGRRQTASFFTLHYGFFHFGYAVFIASGGGLPHGIDLLATLALAVAFAWGLEDTYRRNRAVLDAVPLNLGTAMFMPYLRVIPMHLTILIGGAALAGGGTWTLLVFTVLKTASDVAMHHAEHTLLRRAAQAGRSAG